MVHPEMDRKYVNELSLGSVITSGLAIYVTKEKMSGSLCIIFVQISHKI